MFVAAGVGLYFYFRYEKQKLLEQRRMFPSRLRFNKLLTQPHTEKERESRTIGRAHVGGPFTLTTHHNKPFSELDLLGKWNLVYFGFTNCPDICPAELDKTGVVVDALGKCCKLFLRFSVVYLWLVTDWLAPRILAGNRKRTRPDLPTALHIRRPSTRHPPTSNHLPPRLPPASNRPHRRLHNHKIGLQSLPRVLLHSTQRRPEG